MSSLNSFGGVHFWKLTSILNNLKLNLLILVVIVIIIRQLNTETSKTQWLLLVTFLTFYLFEAGLVRFTTRRVSSLEYYRQLNTSLLNGVLNIHPWITFFCYGFLIWYLLMTINLKTQKKEILNFFFKKTKNKKTLLILISTSILLGGFWSFQELTWGGWWNWDVVELISLNFFFSVCLLTHQNLNQIFKKNLMVRRILVVLVVSIVVVRFNFLTSIHSFIGGFKSKLFFLKSVFVVLFFWLALSLTQGFFKNDFLIIYMGKGYYFNLHLVIIISYIFYTLCIAFIFNQDGGELTRTLHFVITLFYIFYINVFSKINRTGTTPLTIYPLNYILFYTCSLHDKFEASSVKNIHKKFMYVLCAFVFFGVYTTSFSVTTEVQTFFKIRNSLTYYFSNSFFLGECAVLHSIPQTAYFMYYEFFLKPFSLFSDVHLHFYKNKLGLMGFFLFKNLVINDNVTILIYSNLFTITVWIILLSTFDLRRNFYEVN